MLKIKIKYDEKRNCIANWVDGRKTSLPEMLEIILVAIEFIQHQYNDLDIKKIFKAVEEDMKNRKEKTWRS